jgi:quinol monooxygenase YgiN
VTQGDVVVTILWHAVPFRGDKFEDAWRPAAAAALDYGATYWAFLRSKDDPLDFTQIAAFKDKKAFERYRYSEEISEARAETHGLYEVPLLPVWFRVSGAGELAPEDVTA